MKKMWEKPVTMDDEGNIVLEEGQGIKMGEWKIHVNGAYLNIDKDNTLYELTDDLGIIIHTSALICDSDETPVISKYENAINIGEQYNATYCSCNYFRIHVEDMVYFEYKSENEWKEYLEIAIDGDNKTYFSAPNGLKFFQNPQEPTINYNGNIMNGGTIAGSITINIVPKYNLTGTIVGGVGTIAIDMTGDPGATPVIEWTSSAPANNMIGTIKNGPTLGMIAIDGTSITTSNVLTNSETYEGAINFYSN